MNGTCSSAATQHLQPPCRRRTLHDTLYLLTSAPFNLELDGAEEEEKGGEGRIVLAQFNIQLDEDEEERKAAMGVLIPFNVQHDEAEMDEKSDNLN